MFTQAAKRASGLTSMPAIFSPTSSDGTVTYTMTAPVLSSPIAVELHAKCPLLTMGVPDPTSSIHSFNQSREGVYFYASLAVETITLIPASALPL